MSSSSTATHGKPSTGWRAELPWLAATLAGIVLVQLWAHEAPGFPFGSDWGQYLQGADALWRAEESAPFPSWRGPLYMFLLGGPGQSLGYVVAGRLVSRLAAGLCVLAAALAGRAIAGREVAFAAPLLAAGFVPLQQAATWVNPYASLAAAQGLCLAAGLAFARWGWRWAGVSCGLLAAAAVATDPRGWMMVPIALLLGLLAPTPRSGGLWRRRGHQALLLLAMVAGLGLSLWVQRDLPHTPLMQALDEQHVLSAEMVGIKTGPDHPLAACLAEDSSSGRMVTTSTCARHLLSWNLQRMVPRGQVPTPWFLLALPLLLLPTRWGRRGSMAGVAALAIPAASLVAGLAWVEWAPRYSAPYVVPLALLGPAALLSLARLLPWRWPRHGLFWLAVLAWGWWAMPSTRRADQHNIGLPGEEQLLGFARWLDSAAGPGGLVLNCSQQPVDILLLPRPMLASYPIAGNPQRCRGWAEAPPSADGRLLYLSVHDPYTGACSGECAGIDPALMGWTAIPIPDNAPPGVKVWTR
jgi:hypothetical protein